MPRFPSEAWAAEFQKRLNENALYARAAQAWEGDFLFLVAPDEAAPNGEGVHVDLYHGECRQARYVADPDSVRSEFTYRGRRSDWERLLRHEVDPVKAILDGSFQLKGNLLKAMRFTSAAKEMLETAAKVPPD